MASAMPVFPLVGSRMRCPGTSSPVSSAASIIERATRSLTEPVGFCSPSLATMRTPSFGVDLTGSPDGLPEDGGHADGAHLGDSLLDGEHGSGGNGSGRRCTELLVVDELDLLGRLAAHRALRVAVHLQLDELHRQGVVA